MQLSSAVRTSIDKCVLCWLATTTLDHQPNVSPKEIFTYFEEDSIIIANIASPQSVRNIKENKLVCVSFIDILVQKGYQIKGEASIVGQNDEGFSEMEKELLKMTGGNFPFNTITRITVISVKKILAPKYVLYPDTTEEEQVSSAKEAYGL